MSDLLLTVLRAPETLVDRLSEPGALAREAPKLLALVVGSGAVFGAAVGLHRDALQLVYAAVKLPAVLLVPLLVAVPAVRAIAAAFGPEAHPARAAAAGLVGMARTALLAAAAGPAVWLAMSAGIGYSGSILVVAATLAVCGLPGLRVLAAGVSEGRLARFAAGAGAIALYGAVAAQTGWLLRPFILREDAQVVFLRELRGDVFAELARHAEEPDAGVPEGAPARRPAADTVAPVEADERLAISEEDRRLLEAVGYSEGPRDLDAPAAREVLHPEEKTENQATPAEIERLRAIGYL